MTGGKKGIDLYFLAIDTATNSGGVALARNAEIVGAIMLKNPLQYAEKLIAYIDFLLDHSDVDIRGVDCFAVVSGPGSFTGLRSGLAAAKAFCQSLDRPAVSVSSLAALAYRFRHVSDRVAPMIDARRQQVYGALFEVGEWGVRELAKECVSPPLEWLQKLPDYRCLFVGDGAQMYASTIEAARPADRLLRSDNQILEQVCGLAYQSYRAGRLENADSLAAHYIRPSDAEVKL